MAYLSPLRLFRNALPALCWLAGGATWAQTPQLPVRHLGVGEGLPQGSVYALHQDRQGFLWVGTGDGLARWDGRQFRSYRGLQGDTNGKTLMARMVRGPMVESGPYLWFTTNLGLTALHLPTERFRSFPLPGVSEPERLHLLGPYGREGLVCMIDDRLYCLLPNGTLQTRPLPVRGIGTAVQVADTVYAADSTALYRFPTRGPGWRRVRDVSHPVQLFTTPEKSLILWTRDSVLEWRDGHLSAAAPLAPEARSPFMPRLRMPDGSYYGSIPGGLARSHPLRGGLIRFPTAGLGHGISSPLIMSFLLDRSQNLWVGTEGSGLDVVDTKGFRFRSFPQPGVAGLPPELMVKSLLDVGPALWVGTFSQGLYEVDRATGAWRQWLASPKVSRISLLYRDRAGRIWMNRESLLGTVHPATKGFRSVTRIPDPEGSNVAAFSMGEIAPDDFLVGSTFRLHRLRVTAAGTLRIAPVDSGSRITSGIIAAIERWPDGSFFMGKIRDGFYRIRLDDTGRVTVVDHGLHSTGIRDFQPAGDGRHVWMATENGLVYYDVVTRHLRVLDERSGLSNGHIYGIVPEGDSALWVSTNRGLNRLQYRCAPNGSLLNLRVSPYGAGQGLQGNEFNTGAFCRTADGLLAFGGVNGVNWFRAGPLFHNPYPPVVVLTGISVNEKPLQSDTACASLKRLTLPYTSNTLSFTAAALEYTNPAGNQYAYRLEGFDKDWVHGGTNGEARYANLAYGDYIFTVRAANSDGVWSAVPARLQICIRPPWWATVPARLGAGLLLGLGLIWGIRAYVRRKVAARLRALEKQQAVNEERLRISRDMHDELGTGLTKIALLSEVARRRPGPGSPAAFSEITSTSRQLTQKIGEIVWTLNPQNDTLDTLASYLREHLAEQYESVDGLRVRTDFPDSLPHIPLSHSARQAVLLVTKEAVNNAVKYAGAAEIVVSLALAPGAVSFTVRDDGCGFSPGVPRRSATGGNGLGNMAARVRAAGGVFSIDTAPGCGTTVTYHIPHA